MRAILDSGPLIALWNRERKFLSWVENLFVKFSGPYHVTEPILTEVAHLTGRDKAIVQGLNEGRFLLTDGLMDQVEDLEWCLNKFPHCDLADASIIALSERHRRLKVLSMDRRHFVTYRRRDRSGLPLVLPEN